MSNRSIIVVALVGFLAIFCLCTVPMALYPVAQSYRAAAKGARCRHHMVEIGLALTIYHDVFGHYPAAVTTDDEGRPMHCWRVALLPHLGYHELYSQIRLGEPWDSPYNSQFHDQSPPLYQCPNDPSGTSSCSYRVVVGPTTPWGTDHYPRQDDFSDGYKNTIAVVESHNDQINWMEPKPLDMESYLRMVESGQLESHYGHVHAAMFDGKVRELKDPIDLVTLRHLLEHADGNPVEID